MKALTKKPTNKPVCLITGASAGIGAALSEEFAREGWDLVLTARREAPMIDLARRLKAEYGTVSHIIPADLSKPGAVDDILARVARKKVQIDGLVNNAGYGQPGDFMDNDWQTHADFLQLMLMAPTEMTHKVLPHMRDSGFGRILNVASLAGHIPGSKGHTLYGAVKSYLIKFSQSLNLELEDDGIKVSALCPGFTLSEFHDVNDTRASVSKLPSFLWMSAEDVAESGFMALERNRPVYIPGAPNKLIALLVRLIPENWAFALMRKNSQRIRKG